MRNGRGGRAGGGVKVPTQLTKPYSATGVDRKDRRESEEE